MAVPIGKEAAKPNPALEPLRMLVGEWTTVGTHPEVAGKTFHGRTEFAWIENGAFLIMRSEIDEPEIPSGIAIIGTDDEAGTFTMSYFDERGISRKYEVTVRENVWTWSRNAPKFSQRMTATVSDDGRTMTSRGEMSRDDVTWTPDLSLTYTRAG